jgi:hypothetical protein
MLFSVFPGPRDPRGNMETLFPDDWLKIAGSAIFFTSPGSAFAWSRVRHLTKDEIQSPTEQKELEEFDIAIEEKFGPDMNKDDFQNDPDYADFITPTYDCYEDDEVSPSKMSDIDDIKEEHDVDTYDQYFGAHVRVPIGDEIRSGNVLRRKRELDGTTRGRANANPMLDTRTYEIEFPDGRSDEYTTNLIAENMYAQCDIEGRQYKSYGRYY